MNPDQQRIAIAEACGWLRGHACKTCGHGGDQWLSPERTIEIAIPDYLNDLNAMHEAEKEITDEQWPKYRDLLHEMAFQASPKGNKWFRPACCTAAQRAEAFLRTTGLWKDSI